MLTSKLVIASLIDRGDKITRIMKMRNQAPSLEFRKILQNFRYGRNDIMLLFLPSSNVPLSVMSSNGVDKNIKGRKND